MVVIYCHRCRKLGAACSNRAYTHHTACSVASARRLLNDPVWRQESVTGLRAETVATRDMLARYKAAAALRNPPAQPPIGN